MIDPKSDYWRKNIGDVVFQMMRAPADVAAERLQNQFDAVEGAHILQDSEMTVDKAASILDSPNLTADKAASIMDNPNLTASKAASIIDLMPVEKAADILNLLTVQKAADILDLMSVEKAADIYNNFSAAKQEEIYPLLDVHHRSYISFGFVEDYARKVTITEQSGSDLSYYQVLIELNSSNFDFSHAQTNGEDIRFTDASGNLLDYWIEEWDSVNETAKVWVEVPSIPANSSVEIWMYYGNPTVASASDGEAVFEFFDDFDDGIYDLNKWIEPVGGLGTYVEENGYLELTVTGTDAPYRALTNTFTLSDGIIEQKIMFVYTNNVPHLMIFVRQPTDGTYGYGELTARGGTNDDLYLHDGTLKGNVSLGYDLDAYINTWFFMQFKLSGSNAWGYIKNLKTGAETTTSITDFSTLVSPGRLGPGVWNAETTNRIDWFRVRKFADPEPSVSVGAEETA